jgi:hypothetical protein
MLKKARHIGPYSRPHILAKLDGRTKEAMLMRRTRAQLIEHVGGSPSAVELALIDRAVALTLRVAQLDAEIAQGEAQSSHDHRHYLAWSNSLTRTLAKLDAKKVEPSGPSLAEHLARKYGTGAAA